MGAHGENGARPDPAVRVDSVSKTFTLPHEHYQTLKERALHPFRRLGSDRLHALDDVSFEVPTGEFFGIVGRNGSGKSTLLKCLAGIYGLDRGEIRVVGQVSPFIELGVGFNPDLTARDNVVINSVLLGLSPREAHRRFDAIIEFAELEEFVDLKLKNYSSGMHVRLAFAVMVQIKADILLIDEVLAVGDVAFQQKCFDEFGRMRKEGRTVLFVTHAMQLVERFCDRALLLERGRLVEIGDPAHIAMLYNELNYGRGKVPVVPGEEERLGDQSLEIADVWFESADGVRVESLTQTDDCAICVEVVANAADDSPVIAVELLNDDDVRAFSTTSSWVEGGTGRFEPGTRGIFRASLTMSLGPGRYRPTAFILRAGRDWDLIDRRASFAPLLVHGTRVGGGVVDLPHEVSFEKIPAAVSAPVAPDADRA